MTNVTYSRARDNLPPRTGISFKHEHAQEILANPPKIAWFEVHPENYMVDGGPALYYLEKIRERYALSMHGVGLSLGSADGIVQSHLDKLKRLVERYQPEQVSEHLSWSHWQSTFLNDLLPLPLTQESFATVCCNIQRVQDTLKRTILIENPSTYLDFDHHDYSEAEFLNAVCKATGCGLLLDINNIVVSSTNNHQNPGAYLDSLSYQYVQEIHLAGHTQQQMSTGQTLLIDDHGSAVGDQTWRLYEQTLTQLGRTVPTLIEWDTHVPELAILLAEAEKAQHRLDAICAVSEIAPSC